MHAGRDFSPGPKARPRSSEHAWIGVAVGALDQHLRRKQGIVEYTNSPECIFRMQVTQSGHEIALSDGTRFPQVAESSSCISGTSSCRARQSLARLWHGSGRWTGAPDYQWANSRAIWRTVRIWMMCGLFAPI